MPTRSYISPSNPSVRSAINAVIEQLESRWYLSTAPLRPDHVVVVVESDRFANALGDTVNMPYVNQLAASSLVFSAYQGISTAAQSGEMNYLSLYSGSTQGITDNGRGYSFAGANLDSELTAAGLSFTGYSESLPADGAQDQQAGDATRIDTYVRSHNPMAMFTTLGAGQTNANVNKTFNSFSALATAPGTYANLPTVSFVIPNNLDNTNGSNEAAPFATDPNAYPGLRQSADTWLQQNIDPYIQWAKTHNSIVIIVGDSGDRQHNYTAGTEAIVAGDPRLVAAGTDTNAFTEFNTLRTIEDMYGIAPMGSTVGINGFDTTSQGKLGVPTVVANTTTALISNANPSVFGQSVSFTATITPVGGGTPTGQVLLKDGAATIGTSTLSGGVATFSLSSLAVGSHTLTAVYSGDTNFNGSTSTALSDVVNQAATTASVASSVNPSTIGQSVTFSAKVVVTTPGAGSPTGTVTFFDGAANLGNGTIVGGLASLTTSTLSQATHTITAVYSGDANFKTSTSSPFSQVVSAAANTGTTTAVSTSTNPSVFGQSLTFTATVTSQGTGTPAGTVNFLDGATVLGTGTLNGSGVATFTTASLSVASHSITAVYGGGTGFNGSTSTAITQNVSQASSAAVLSSSLNPATVGQSITFTATISAIAPGAGTPTGTVTFFDGATNLGTGTLSAGVATLATSALTQATHSVTAVYAGDTNFKTVTSSAVSQVVNGSSTVGTATAVSSSSIASVSGQSVTFTATVTPQGTGTPTGTVTFLDGTATLGTGTLNGSGIATFTTSSLSIASHSITASYGGGTGFTGSTSPAITQVVAQASSSTALVASSNPVYINQAVTFTATVTAASPGSGTPTGSIVFKDATTTLATVALSGGVASFTIATLSIGTHSITANYAGDAKFKLSTSPILSQVITQGGTVTITSMSASVNPTTYGQSVSFTALVTTSGGTTPTGGTVSFLDHGTSIGSATLSAGSAKFTTTALTGGSHSIQAIYVGGGSFAGSYSGILSQTTTLASTTTTVAASVNPVAAGTPVTYTATVNVVSPGAGTRTGTVTFFDGATAIGTGTVSAAGTATFTLTYAAGGTHTITAVYAGDTNFKTSTSGVLSEVVTSTAANTTTAVSSSASSSVFGQSVTFTATVTSTGTPAGTVSFLDGATVLGTGTLNGSGAATFTTSSLSVASHSITASYGGGTGFNSSTSTAITQTVSQASSAAALSSSLNPATVGQSITFTATISAITPGAGTPTGTVTFFDGATNLGTGTLSAGVATLTTSALTQATHSITAVYAGDTNFKTVTSSPVSEVVNAATVTGLVKPDHVVIVMMEDRYANAIGDTTDMPYINTLANSGLVYSNFHGLNTTDQDGEMNFIGLYSGSTQGVTDDGLNYSFDGPNLGSTLNNTPGLSFAGYNESLPSDGSQVPIAAEVGGFNIPDLYSRAHNAPAMFTDAGVGKTNADVNKTFDDYKSLTAGGNFSALPTVSLISPNQLNDTHGSNDADPYATDPTNYDYFRQTADAWMQANVSAYVQWAMTHNSILIITGDEGDRQHVYANGFQAIVVGDPRIVVPGTDSTSYTAFNTLRTIEDMYGITQLGSTGAVAELDHNSLGQLAAPAVPAAPTAVAATQGTLPDRVRITWTAPTGATGFEVWRSTTNDSSTAARITTTDVTGSLFDDTTAVSGQTYFYWVKSKNAGGTSGFSLSTSGYRP